MQRIGAIAARHEALEFFLAKQIITGQEWPALRREALASGWIDETGVREAYTKQFGKEMGTNQLADLILKESIMQKYGEYEAGTYKPDGVIASVFKRMHDILKRMISKLRGEEATEEKRKRFKERYQLFLACSLACFLLNLLIRPYPAQPGARLAPARSPSQGAARRTPAPFVQGTPS